MTSIQYKILLTREQREKKRVVEERIDQKGVVIRYRVEDQTIFDKMLVEDLIDRPQHEAGHRFLSVVEISGAFPASCSLDSHGYTPSYQVGDIIGEKRMAFGSAYRAVVFDCGEGHADQFVHIVGKLYRDVDLKNKSIMRRLSRIVYRPLVSLSKYFRTTAKKDPRNLISEKREAR